jgi:O-acetylserine/cysteine efflux transporter
LQLAIRPLHLLLFLMTVTIWGFSFIVTKWGVQEMPPIFFVGLRFLLVALILVPFVPRPRGHWKRIVQISVTLGLLHFSCMFVALVRTPAGTTALLAQLQVPFAALLAALFLGDRLGWRRALGMALAFAGAGVVLGAPSFASPWWSDLLAVLAGLFWAISAVQIKSMGSAVGAASINGWVAVCAVPQLFVASLILEQGQWAAIQGMSWRLAFALFYNSVLNRRGGLWYLVPAAQDLRREPGHAFHAADAAHRAPVRQPAPGRAADLEPDRRRTGHRRRRRHHPGAPSAPRRDRGRACLTRRRRGPGAA